MVRIVSVILSGGSGNRLWPASRTAYPKQFLEFGDAECLLSRTIKRASLISQDSMLVTTRDMHELCKASVPNVGFNSFEYILEPFGRNTASAVALAAHRVLIKYPSPETVMVILPSDHLVKNDTEFVQTIRKGADLALKDYLVLYGERPSCVDTGYGYIKPSMRIDEGFEVTKFIEKPDAIAAQKIFESGEYLWNTGIFCFKPAVYLKELSIHEPTMSKLVEEFANEYFICYEDSTNQVRDNSYARIPNKSIDKTVMEKSDKLVVVPLNVGWSDLGNWNSIYTIAEKDENSNASIGEDIACINSDCNFVYSKDRLVVLNNVSNLLVVDTTDALYISKNENSQEIRDVVEKVGNINPSIVNDAEMVFRPWGNYKYIFKSRFCIVKKLFIFPGHKISLQKHNHRSEHWVVISGLAVITIETNVSVYGEGESALIPSGVLHRIENNNSEPCIIIETQFGNFLTEDDIERYDDQYGRQTITDVHNAVQN